MTAFVSDIGWRKLIRLIEERQRLAEVVKHHELNRHGANEQPEGASLIHLTHITLTRFRSA